MKLVERVEELELCGRGQPLTADWDLQERLGGGAEARVSPCSQLMAKQIRQSICQGCLKCCSLPNLSWVFTGDLEKRFGRN